MQLYDATKTPPTELGAPVALSITGDGTAGSPYVATLGPFAQPLRMTVAVQATGGAGSVSTALSDQSTAVVVGESACGQHVFLWLLPWLAPSWKGSGRCCLLRAHELLLHCRLWCRPAADAPGR